MSSLWQTAQAPDGRTYYYNTVTKQTQWTPPDATMTPRDLALSQQPFQEYTAEDGRKYWYNKETKVSTWEIPEVYKNALAQSQLPPTPSTPTTTYVAGGTPIFAPYQVANRRSKSRDRTYGNYDRGRNGRSRSLDRNNAYNQPDTFRSNIIPATAGEVEYATTEEAEAAFFKCMRRFNVQPDWTFRQMVDACVRDPQYRSIKDPKDRWDAFEKYKVEAKQQEKEREKERVAKLRQDFRTMLKSHPDIGPYTRYKTARPIIEGETLFRSTDNEAERRQLFLEYIHELRDAHAKQQVAMRASALDNLVLLLRHLALDPYMKLGDALRVLRANERFQNDDKFKSLSKVDILTSLGDHFRLVERNAIEERQRQKNQKSRIERRHRDEFKALLRDLKSKGLIKAGILWTDVETQIQNDPRYLAVAGQPGSTPLDLFWDVIEEEEQTFRVQRNEVLDVLDDRRFELTAQSTLDQFIQVVQSDRRTSHMRHDILELIYTRLHDKVAKQEEEDRHQAERAQRHKIEALRSVIKHLEPPVRSTDTWDRDVRPRVEKHEAFRGLDEEGRRTAFEKFLRRLKEKEAEAEQDRATRRTERDSRRNGDRREVRDHAAHPRIPEHDAYEADRKRAVAERERQYRKTSTTAAASPPDSRGGRHAPRDRGDDRNERYAERDRYDDAERNDRYDRASGRLGGPYERGPRERDLFDRPFNPRADPRDTTARELDYGESGRAGSMSLDNGLVGKRRGSSEDGDKRDVKRAKKEIKGKSKTPVIETPEKEEEALKSGSEEGEIEEV